MAIMIFPRGSLRTLCLHRHWREKLYERSIDSRNQAKWLLGESICNNMIFLPLQCLYYQYSMASTMIIDRQIGKDWAYFSRLKVVAVATDKCWVKISVEISRLNYIFWICRQRSMIMVEASNSSWKKNDFEIASFFFEVMLVLIITG